MSQQAVKRHFNLVTEASSVTIWFASRGGLIRQQIKSRHLMKRFDTKKQFACYKAPVEYLSGDC